MAATVDGVGKGSWVTCSTSETLRSPVCPPVVSRRRRTLLALIVVATLGVAALLAGVESAAASTTAPTGDVTTVAPSPTATPPTTASPSPTPSPSETPDRSHEKRNGEQGVQRDDLGFAGLLVVIAFAFILTMGASGVLLAGRARRRRDRAEAAAAEKETGDA